MHINFLATGILNQLREFEIWWHTRQVMLPFTKDGKTLYQPLQAQLRPMMMYELVFPRNELSHVLNTLAPFDPSLRNKESRMPFNKFEMLRKMLKLNKIPEWDRKAGSLPFPPLNVGVYTIGSREDEDKEFGGDEGFHEAL